METSQETTTPQHTEGMSYDTKVILVVLLLIFFWPAGIILMWMWMKTWPMWLRIVLTALPVVFILIWLAFMFFFFFIMAMATTQQDRDYTYDDAMPVQEDYFEEIPMPATATPTLSPLKTTVPLPR